MKRQPSPHDEFLPDDFPDDDSWTDHLTRVGSERGIYRQCSIGWHKECSQRRYGPEAECACLCHATPPTQTTLITGYIDSTSLVPPPPGHADEWAYLIHRLTELGMYDIEWEDEDE